MMHNKRWLQAVTAVLMIGLWAGTASAQQQWPEEPPEEPPEDWGPVSANFEEIDYPYPVEFLELTRFKKHMRMAYMDVPPSGTPNGQTVFWQHGMNFYSEAYTDSINRLSEAGFRVIAVDRIGYAKSSKPIIPYDFNFVAANMKALLDELGIEETAIVGHSMGGMVVSRFAMVYPEVTTHVVMANQIGMTDQRQSRTWSDPYMGEPGTPSYQSILSGHVRYYPNEWPPEHLKYVKRQYGQTMSGEWPRLSRIRSLQGQMLYEDPVVYDWQHIDSKALVIGGEDDDLADDFAARARHVADELQNSTLQLYEDIGHNPQVEIPERFHSDLISFLSSDPDEPASEWQN